MLEYRWTRVAVILNGALIIAAGALFLFFGISSREQSNVMLPPVQLVLPGSMEVTFDSAGVYMLYHEYIARTDSADYSSDTVPDQLMFRVYDLDSARYLSLADPETADRYEWPGRAGVAILQFEIPRAGRYRLEGFYTDGRQKPRFMFAVGRRGRMTSALLRGGGMFIGGFLVGFALMSILVKGLSRRRRNRSLSLPS